MEFIKSIFDLTKLPTKVSFLVAFLSGLLLFANNTIIQALKLQKFIDKYGEYIGVAFIFSTSLVLINFIIWVFEKISASYNERKFKEQLTNELKQLDHQECAVVREFYLVGQSTIKMPIDDPVVSGLLKKGIIEATSHIGRHHPAFGMYFPVSLSENAKLLMQYEYMRLPKNPSEKDRAKLLENRPHWTSVYH